MGAIDEILARKKVTRFQELKKRVLGTTLVVTDDDNRHWTFNPEPGISYLFEVSGGRLTVLMHSHDDKDTKWAVYSPMPILSFGTYKRAPYTLGAAQGAATG